ncbi:MAG: hypothetical protein EA001_04705 [Oscillatoriales cyanobacterium]|nr:MAG: hypothetical protein EA001_04705 [Oscillatoriales cyanobacterium]
MIINCDQRIDIKNPICLLISIHRAIYGGELTKKKLLNLCQLFEIFAQPKGVEAHLQLINP